MRTLLSLVFLFVLETVQGSDPYPRNDALDIIHYDFKLELNDSTDRIAGESSVRISFRKSVSEFELDLTGMNAAGKGMTVQDVQSDGQVLKFVHQNDRIRITLLKETGIATKTIVIRYSGIPADGLVIGKNKFGDRSFFGDNWPDHGHDWLPCVDHPSDKATVDFIIVAPEKYQVVASGRLKEISNLDRGRRLTHWEETIEIAVKVMTVGVARFAMKISGVVDQIPSSTWVYPQNRDDGFHDFAVGVRVFEYFHRNVGPYSYEKLAHVQSKTRWGGLENASNIFYTESSVNGKNDHEGLIAHETAHQWFGNSVTENDWHHVWLSEGFATYFAALYMEHTYGAERLREEMKADRKQTIEYFKKNPKPIVDTTIVDINKVLSTNTYQKAGWVLHMLRKKIGDDAFWKGIREYYSRYRNKNVLTGDFRKEMEKASGQSLTAFFNQWLYHGGHPKLEIRWNYNDKLRQIRLAVNQMGPVFDFPLEILSSNEAGAPILQKIQVSKPNEEFTIPCHKRPAALNLDPETWLLFEAEVKASR